MSLRALALLPPMLLVGGCYQFVPTANYSPVGRTVSVEVNDPGRVALTERLGPELRSVEGVVASADSADLTVHVSAVSSVSGQRTMWTGEEVQIPRSFVKGLAERRFSPTRTLVVVGGAVALVLVSTQTDLLGIGRDDSSPDPVRPPVDQ